MKNQEQTRATKSELNSRIEESKGWFWVVGEDGHKAFETRRKAQNYLIGQDAQSNDLDN